MNLGKTKSSVTALMMMLLVVSLQTVLAQSASGTWTGYVNGWVPDRTTSVTAPVARLGYAPQPWWWWTQAQWQHTQLTVMNLAQRQHEVEAEWVAAQQRLEQRQELMRAQQRVQQLEREAQALREQQQREQDLAQAQHQAAEARAQALKSLEVVPMAREKEPAPVQPSPKASGKGPDIHRWVDEEGVVHYSTRPRNRR
jgi:hypothetical protein